jgi:hypothetical protein
MGLDILALAFAGASILADDDHFFTVICFRESIIDVAARKKRWGASFFVVGGCWCL